MRTVRLEVTLTYDDESMHGDSEDGLQWFMDDILRDAEPDELVLHSNEIGEDIGIIRVVRILEDKP